MTWKEVTRMNIYTFNHRCNFLVHKRKEAIKKSR